MFLGNLKHLLKLVFSYSSKNFINCFCNELKTVPWQKPQMQIYPKTSFITKIECFRKNFSDQIQFFSKIFLIWAFEDTTLPCSFKSYLKALNFSLTPIFIYKITYSSILEELLFFSFKARLFRFFKFVYYLLISYLIIIRPLISLWNEDKKY